jgi:hypothetical protein
MGAWPESLAVPLGSASVTSLFLRFSPMMDGTQVVDIRQGVHCMIPKHVFVGHQ